MSQVSVWRALPVLFLFACGGEKAEPRRPEPEDGGGDKAQPDGGGDMAQPDAGGELAPDEPCTIEDAVMRHIGGAPDAVDCGTLRLDISAERSAEAQTCVLDALEANKPFYLVHYGMGIDSEVAEGFVRAPGEVGVTIYSYDSDPSGGSDRGARITVHPCETFGPYDDCDPTPGFACLECLESGPTDLYCDDSK